MNKAISLRTFDSLGCSVSATGVILAIKDKFPKVKLTIHTKFPELFIGIEGISVTKKELEHYDVDLRKYIERRPHNSKPYRPIYAHMTELAEELLKTKLKIITPKIFLSRDEISEAKKIINKYNKPVIWIETKTSSPNKDWTEDYWSIVVGALSKKYTVLSLSNTKFSIRQSLALTKVCAGGITLDTFLIHGSAAVDAKNVIVLLGSSRKEVVSYPNQTVLFIKVTCSIQPCGMHGYGMGVNSDKEKLFTNHQKSRCIFDDYRCMKIIKPKQVISAIEDVLN